MKKVITVSDNEIFEIKRKSMFGNKYELSHLFSYSSVIIDFNKNTILVDISGYDEGFSDFEKDLVFVGELVEEAVKLININNHRKETIILLSLKDDIYDSKALEDVLKVTDFVRYKETNDGWKYMYVNIPGLLFLQDSFKRKYSRTAEGFYRRIIERANEIENLILYDSFEQKKYMNRESEYYQMEICAIAYVMAFYGRTAKEIGKAINKHYDMVYRYIRDYTHEFDVVNPEFAPRILSELIEYRKFGRQKKAHLFL